MSAYSIKSDRQECPARAEIHGQAGDRPRFPAIATGLPALFDILGAHGYGGTTMTTKLEQEEYLYRRAIDIIESTDTDPDKEELLFEEVWVPLAALYKDKITAPGPD